MPGLVRALRTGVHVDDLKIMAKAGSFMRILRDTDEADERCCVQCLQPDS